MIIIKYLIQEILKNQLAILFILLLIFLCQKLVRILTAAVNGEILTNLVITLLWLGIPEIAQLILPLSLFLAILITLARLYTENEITAMYACGFSEAVLIKATMVPILITMLVAAVNIIWFSPWSLCYQNELKQKVKMNPSVAGFAAGRFQQLNNGNNVLFIESVNGNQFNHIFLAHLHHEGNKHPSVVIADNGYMEKRIDGSQVITLNKGTYFEGITSLHDFRITDFTHYQAIIDYKTITLVDPSDADQVDFIKLLRNSSPEFRSELHWRLTLIFSALVMALMVVPLSMVNPRQDRVSVLPAILLYLIFFLLQSLLKSNSKKGLIDPAIWIWVVNLSYLIFSIILNLWNTVLMRRLRDCFANGDLV